jgi:WD40 repeat protein
MPYFDKVLVQPSQVDLDRAVHEAVESANRGSRTRLLAWPPPGYETFLPEHARQPEGWRRWATEPAGGLVLVWWTDHAARRHYRVAGGHGRPAGLPRLEHLVSQGGTARPPLALIYPQAFQRSRGGESRLLVQCACGAFGEPAALGWMGPCCGPCHDRAESGEGMPALGGGWVWEGDEAEVSCLDFSPDGRSLATGGHGGHVRLWDVRAGAVRATSERQPSVASLAYSPDGRTLALGTRGRALLLDADRAAPWRHLWIGEGELYGEVSQLAFGPDGSWLVGKYGSRVARWDVSTGLCRLLTPGNGVGFSRLSLTPDGQALAVLLWGGQVVLYDVASGNVQRRVPLPERASAALACSPDGRHLATTLADTATRSRLVVWDLARERLVADWPAPRLAGEDPLLFSPDGRTLACGRGAGVHAWDVRSGERAVLSWDSQDVRGVAFSPDGRHFAACTGGSLRVWPIEVLRS